MHPDLAWLREEPGGAAWIDELPALLKGCANDWDLELAAPYAYASVSLAMPARSAVHGECVLKVQFPSRESHGEAEALRVWDGEGAVRLLDHHPGRHALLLERCVPGGFLEDAGPDRALAVYEALLPRLWIDVPDGGTIPTLAAQAAAWGSTLERDWSQAGEPFPRALLDETLAWLTEGTATQGRQVLVHQDLHPDNVLSAEREPWLAIDPKPVIAEREFALAPIVRAHELGHTRDAVIGRLDRLSTALGLDRERCRRWTIAQTMAWAFDDGSVDEDHLDVILWLADA